MLKKNLEDGHFGLLILFTFATGLSIILYLMVSLMDPGFVKESDADVRPVSWLGEILSFIVFWKSNG